MLGSRTLQQMSCQFTDTPYLFLESNLWPLFPLPSLLGQFTQCKNLNERLSLGREKVKWRKESLWEVQNILTFIYQSPMMDTKVKFLLELSLNSNVPEIARLKSQQIQDYYRHGNCLEALKTKHVFIVLSVFICSFQIFLFCFGSIENMSYALWFFPKPDFTRTKLIICKDFDCHIFSAVTIVTLQWGIINWKWTLLKMQEETKLDV